jgi:hypothetical protein
MTKRSGGGGFSLAVRQLGARRERGDTRNGSGEAWGCYWAPYIGSGRLDDGARRRYGGSWQWVFMSSVLAPGRRGIERAA